MILVGSQRAGAAALADHLTNERDNDHVKVLELRDFMADDLHGALAEAHAISKATQCKQFMFSLSLKPPGPHIASEDEFRDAAYLGVLAVCTSFSLVLASILFEVEIGMFALIAFLVLFGATVWLVRQLPQAMADDREAFKLFPD